MKVYTFNVTPGLGQIEIHASRLHTALGRLGETLEAREWDKDKSPHAMRAAIEFGPVWTIKKTCQHIDHTKHTLAAVGSVNWGGAVRRECAYFISTFQGREQLNHRWVTMCRVCHAAEEKRKQEFNAGQKKLGEVQQ